MGENSTGAIGRREAIKLGAKAAGVTAFAAPVVVGVFSAPAVGQTTQICSPAGDSDVVIGTIDPGSRWNQNCGGGSGCPNGRYNGQTRNFTFLGGAGTVFIGGSGTDNTCAAASYYTITATTGFHCTAEFTVANCTGGTGDSSGGASGTGPVPYCLNSCIPQGSNNAELVLTAVYCCPN